MGVLWSMAWRNVLRHRRRSLLTAAAMAIAVAVVSAIMVLTEGMYGQMKEAVIDRTLGHAQVHHPDYPGRRQMYDALDDVDALLASISAVDGVTGVAPRLFGQGLIGASQRTEGAQLFGIDPSREAALRDLTDRVVVGAWLGDTPSHGIVLGVDLAARLETEVGEELVIVTQAADGSLGNDLYTVTGVVRTGIPTLDRGVAYLHRADLGALLALDGRAHEIVVLTEDRAQASLSGVVEAVRSGVGDAVLVQPWWEVDPTTEQLFAMQSFTGWVLIVFFFGVSAVGVVNTLLMSVLERTREIGVMRALGMRPGEVVRLVVAEALILSALAVGLGLAGAAVLDTWLIVRGIDFTVQGEGYQMNTMTFDPVVHGAFTPDAIWQPVVGVFVFGVLAALWPAIRAARLQPIDALREV